MTYPATVPSSEAPTIWPNEGPASERSMVPGWRSSDRVAARASVAGWSSAGASPAGAVRASSS